MIFQRLSLLLLFTFVLVQANQTATEPPGYIDCPFCADPTHVPQSNFSVFTTDEHVFSCKTAFELGVLRLPEENCTFWQSRGSTICNCASEPPPENNCTLCEDGSAVPEPRKLGAPGRLCAQLEADARWDKPENCIAWQQTIGVYCGCGNPQATALGQDVCRICGDGVDLPDPLASVPLLTDDGTETSASCGELEFDANILGSNCNQFQVLYSQDCCATSSVSSEDDDTSASSQSFSVFVFFPLCALLLARY